MHEGDPKPRPPSRKNNTGAALACALHKPQKTCQSAFPGCGRVQGPGLGAGACPQPESHSWQGPQRWSCLSPEWAHKARATRAAEARPPCSGPGLPSVQSNSFPRPKPRTSRRSQGGTICPLPSYHPALLSPALSPWSLCPQHSGWLKEGVLAPHLLQAGPGPFVSMSQCLAHNRGFLHLPNWTHCPEGRDSIFVSVCPGLSMEQVVGQE